MLGKGNGKLNAVAPSPNMALTLGYALVVGENATSAALVFVDHIVTDLQGVKGYSFASRQNSEKMMGTGKRGGYRGTNFAQKGHCSSVDVGK